MSYVSPNDLAEELGVSPKWVYRHGSQIPGRIKLPSGHIRFDLVAARAWMLSCARQGEGGGMARPRGSGQGSVRWHRNRWEARVRVDGKRLTKRFASKSEAYDWIAKSRLGQIASGDSCGGLTVKALVERFIADRERRHKAGTVRYYRDHLERPTTWAKIHQDARVSAVTRHHLQDWVDKRQREVSPSTVIA